MTRLELINANFVTTQTDQKHVLVGARPAPPIRLRGSMPCVQCGRTVSANAGICAACLDAMADRVISL